MCLKLFTIFFLLLSTQLSAEQYSEIPLTKIIPSKKQSEMGLNKLSSSEKEKLRLFLIDIFMKGFKEGEKEASKRIFKKNKSTYTTPEVIESQIDGDFEGWEGETVVKLMNGQIWMQTEYYYEYMYAYMPDVLIYKSSGGYKMKVEGIDQAVEVRLLK